MTRFRTGTATTALSLLLLMLVFGAISADATRATRQNPYEDSLPIWMTPEEEARIHEIGTYQVPTAAPPGPVRNPGEFEPMTGVIVRYPFGNPTSLLAEYSQETDLLVICGNSSQQSAASSALSSAGANMSNVSFFLAATDSYWTRDYGPWFIINGSDEQGIVDHDYNRPRPNDDVIPSLLAAHWGIPAYVMDLTSTGGNYMSDGRGVAMSSRMILDENTSLTEQEIDDIMYEYVGIDRFEKLEYVQTG
ncbi:agmatine deiminase family protein, partial [bacterium]|nr:agmatine deiminase family protein [bacterium]